MKQGIIEIGKGILAFFCGGLQVLGCFPLVPAFFARCNTAKGASFAVILGSTAGMFVWMPLGSILKYGFILVIIALATRMYRWVNRGCHIWEAAAIAGVATMIMHMAEHSFLVAEMTMLLKAVSEGFVVAGMTVLFQLLGQIQEWGSDWLDSIFNGEGERKVIKGRGPIPLVADGIAMEPVRGPQMERMESFASAVGGLSDAFLAMSQPKEKLVTEEVGALEQELTGKLCASCQACALCWNENRMKRQGSIRALLYAVVNHSSKEDLLLKPYVEDCGHYENMVEEALQAFGRLELNHAWYNRLQENRYVIAKQLDAMAGLMEQWVASRKNVDAAYQRTIGQISLTARERGLVIEEIHVYEENKRLCVEAVVATKWEGGIPSRQYLSAVESVLRKPMRMGKDSRNVLTKEGSLVTLYEDTRFYALQGIAAEKKNGSMVNGDNYVFFAMDDGNYHICLSDGMGSGNRAKQESEMVVELLQKFIEAGFHKETAIKLMNSAMVLQGENNSYSTLDYALVDLYSGSLELIKIGGAATFIKRGQEVECIDEGNLPAGADVRMEIESTKKQLQSGDFLVMVTDGVIEYLHVRNPKELLADIIANAESENAGVLAEYILKQVLERTGGYAMDDMTVLVTGIWEK